MKNIITLFMLLFLVSKASAFNHLMVMGGAVTSEAGSPISIIGVSSAQSNSTDAFALTMPVGTTEGHQMIAIIADDQSTEPTWSCSGWAQMSSYWHTVGNGPGLVAFSKTAAAAESGPYDFDENGSGTYCAGVIITLSKTGGTWDLDQASNTSEIPNSQSSITTGSVTCTDDSILIVVYANEGGKTVNTAPDSVTVIGTETLSSLAIAGYYELRNAGAITKTLVWSANDESASMALVLDIVP